MFLHLELVTNDAEVRAALSRDGWRLEQPLNGDLQATHPAVDTELAARTRLDRVGLLISPRVRIRFVQGRKRPDVN
jgi:hypothetical protein